MRDLEGKLGADRIEFSAEVRLKMSLTDKFIEVSNTYIHGFVAGFLFINVPTGAEAKKTVSSSWTSVVWLIFGWASAEFIAAP